MNERRRLLAGENIEYVFELKDNLSDSNYNNVYIMSTADGEDCEIEVLSYDGSVTLATVYKNTSNVSVLGNYRINVKKSSSSVDSRSGNVVLKQLGSNKMMTITIIADGIPLTQHHNCILLDGTNSSSGNTVIRGLNSGVDIYGCGIATITKPDWINVTYSRFHKTLSDGSFIGGYNINVSSLLANYTNNIRKGDITIKLGENRETTVTVIQLQSNYHNKYYVPISGTNWGIKNVGASSITDIGNYYQWGAGSTTFVGNTNQYYTGSESPLPSSVDTATLVLGSGWRMPTLSDLFYLTNNLNYFAVYNNVDGYAVTDGTNVIFFKIGGCMRNDNSQYNQGITVYIPSSTSKGPNGTYIAIVYSRNDFPLSIHVSASSGGYKNYGYLVRGVYG